MVSAASDAKSHLSLLHSIRTDPFGRCVDTNVSCRAGSATGKKIDGSGDGCDEYTPKNLKHTASSSETPPNTWGDYEVGAWHGCVHLQLSPESEIRERCFGLDICIIALISQTHLARNQKR